MTRLIALDWGTTSLRAFLIEDGRVIETRKSPHGIQKLPEPGGEAGFNAAFTEICGPWIQADPALPVVAGGMVGSAQGWREAPYVPLPAAISDIARLSVSVETDLGARLHIAPGLVQDAPGLLPDVMRGEEIQILGAVSDHPERAEASRIILPGTHSKWVRLRAGRITDFATYMTGEVFDLLSNQSLLSRLMVGAGDEADRDTAFLQGVDLASESGPGDLTRQIFSARSLGLTGRMAGNLLRDYLSGLIIGHEITSARREIEPGEALLMIGEGALCARYLAAMAHLGLPPVVRLENTAPAGLWLFARSLGLLDAAK